MDSGLLQKDPYNIIDDEEEEFYSIRTRQRAATKQITRKNTSTRKVANEIEPQVENALIGENGLGLTAEELRALPESERKQLMEVFVLSKEEYNRQTNKMKSEQLDGHTPTSASKKPISSMPVKLECSIPVVINDAAVAEKSSVVPKLNRFKFKRGTEVAAEGKMPTETAECHVNEDFVTEATLISHLHGHIGTEKLRLSAGKPETGETYSRKKNDVKIKTYPEDCLVVQKSNLPDTLIWGDVQVRRRRADRFSSEKDASRLQLANDDNRQTSARDVSATLIIADTTDDSIFECPDSPTSYELVRKYRIQAADMRPLFRQNELDLKTRCRLIYDYYTDCELKRYKSFGEINSRTQWSRPVAIEVNRGKASTRSRRLREVVAETAQVNERSPHKNENQLLNSPVYNACNTESEELNKRMVIPEHSDFVEPFPSFIATRKSVDVSVVMDNQYTQKDIEILLRRSRQTKIGGGLVEDEEDSRTTSRRKLPMCDSQSAASDDENDPDFTLDFTPEKKKRRIHVDSEHSEKRKKRRLVVVKGKGSRSRKTREQTADCSKASKGEKVVSSNECDGETQETRNLANGSNLQSVGNCQTQAMSKPNGNNFVAHSSGWCEDVYEMKSTTVSRMEDRHKSFNDNLKNICAVDQGALNGCHIHVELDDVLSTSPVFGRNSSSRDDAKQQVFPVFQKLVRPCLRENEGNADIRNSPSTSKTSNSMQTEENEECLSSSSSEGDDCNLEKNTKKRKKGKGRPPAFAKTYQKRKIKNAADQQTIISYATPSFKIPKLTGMCPLCQKDFPVSNLEEHVQKCIQMDDEKKT